MNVNDIIDGTMIQVVRTKFEETAAKIWLKVYENARLAERGMGRYAASGGYERD